MKNAKSTKQGSLYEQELKAWQDKGNEIVRLCGLDTSRNVVDELAVHGKNKPTEKPVEVVLGGRITVRYMKLRESIDKDTGSKKLSGGNIWIVNEGGQPMYQSAPAFAYFIDGLKQAGLDNEVYHALRIALEGHLPHTKHHKNAIRGMKQSKGSKDSDVKIYIGKPLIFKVLNPLGLYGLRGFLRFRPFEVYLIIRPISKCL